MILQRMKRFEGDEWDETVCAMGNLHGKEFTVCGDDAVCEAREGKYNEELLMKPIGNPFIGKLKDVTCHRCLAVIRFIKDFR